MIDCCICENNSYWLLTMFPFNTVLASFLKENTFKNIVGKGENAGK